MATLFDEVGPVARPPALTLRPYQNQTHDRIRALYDAGTTRQLLVAATGTGKTVQFATLPERFPELARHRMLVVVHRTELAEQAAEKVRWANPRLTVGIEMGERRAGRFCDVVVASVQTLGRTGSRRAAKFEAGDDAAFGIVVVDEAHHCGKGGQYEAVLDRFGVGPNRRAPLPDGHAPLLLGVTATPNRHDGQGLAQFFDDIPATLDIRWGVDEGYLTDIRAVRVETGLDISTVRTRAGDFKPGDLQRATNTHERNEAIVKAFVEHGGHRAIAFCAGVAHAYDLASEFRAFGIEAHAVDGAQDRDERAHIIERFRDGGFPILTNCAVATEGFDVPAVDTILMARPTKSTPLYVQMVGRGTRPVVNPTAPSAAERREQIAASAKPSMFIVDFTDNAGTHSLITAPRLFGLAESFQAGGRSLVAAAARVEALEKEHPGKPLRKATSLDEIEIVARTLSVWDVAATPESLEAVTSLHWMGLSEDTYQLVIPGDKVTADDQPPLTVGADAARDPRPTVVTLQSDDLGRFRASIARPAAFDGRRMREAESLVSDRVHHSVEEAVAAVDSWVREVHRGKLTLLTRGEAWQGREATDKQLRMLRRFKVYVPPGYALDRGSASRLIDAALARQRAAAAPPTDVPRPEVARS